MSEKLAEVYEQYDMEILNTRKGRGATILTTDDGMRILEPFRGNVTRLEQEYVLKQLFFQKGYLHLDAIILNKNGMLFTCDKYRQPFVLKEYFDGNECDLHNQEEVVRAVRALAIFHTYGREVAAEFNKAWSENCKEKEAKQIEEIKRALEKEEELEKLSFLYEIKQETLDNIIKEYQMKKNKKEDPIGTIETKKNEKEAVEWLQQEKRQEDILDLFLRHNKELRKIRAYVKRVKRKNDFENLLLQVFEDFHQQGMARIQELKDGRRKENRIVMKNIMEAHSGICHGTFNQHNIIMGKDSEFIVHFERFTIGNQLLDLYQFARKTMEKNHFEFELLREIYRAYEEKIVLSKEDLQYMYVLFSYPEKFWKIANSYYNTNKAFLSPKYLEKLQTVILQESEKRKMLEQYQEIYL